MITTQITIATISLVREAQEEHLLRESLQQLAALQLPVIITDGGSPAHFLDFMRSFPHFTVLQATAKGVWAQARSSLIKAYESGAGFILYTEPDKLTFFQDSLAIMLNKATLHEHTGIVVASRSEAGFTTFPAFQQMTETAINNCCQEVIGKDFDYTYGPFLLNRKLVPYLDLVQEDIGWGWRPYTFAVASRLGYNIDAYTADFYCPAGQRADDAKERLYRMRQLKENIQGIVLSATVNLKKQ